MPTLVEPQSALWCACGRSRIHARGLCASCYAAWRRSQTHFGGLRDQALIRDGKRCVTCGEIEWEQILVHHRRPGLNRLRWFRTLCRRCHPRIHHTLRPRFGFPEELRILWREQHPGLAEQLELALSLAPLLDDGPLVQVSLFEAA